jgi:hypothetical protein
VLEKSIDARKNKVGDEVVAKTTQQTKSQGQVVIPKSSKIIGHVTEIKARSKEEPDSVLGITFDRALLKSGGEMALNLEIQAVAPAESAAPPMMAMSPATAAGGSSGSPASPGQGGNMGPMSDPNSGTPGRIASPESSAIGATETLTPTGGLTPSCHGVLGIDGLALGRDPARSAAGPLIVSQRRNVHLDSGTQMMLRVLAN